MSGLEPGSSLGGYRILARLRAGAMGVLYLARRQGPGGFARPVAIKVIHDHLAQNKRFARMFIDEAKLSAKIDDPNVVRVEEFGEDHGRYYIVMEYVHGASLAQVIGVLKSRGGVPKEHAVAIAMQICGGLHGAHEAVDEDGTPLGIVHRDVSPHNVLVSFRGNVRVIDFGIAKARQVGGQTKTGSLRGKLAYMPPEQARSARTVDRRADLYCVGLMVWEMLTGRRLFDAETDIAILNQIREHKIVPPSAYAQGIPKALDDLVVATLSHDPDGRPASGAALRRLLGEALPAALTILPADIAGLMNQVKDAATAAPAKPEADAASSYGDELRRSMTIYTQSISGLGGKLIEDDDPASSTEPKTLDRRSKAPEQPSKPPSSGPVQDETLAMAGRVVDAAAPGEEELSPAVRTRPGAPKQRTVMMPSGGASGVMPPSGPPMRPPMASDPFMAGRLTPTGPMPPPDAPTLLPPPSGPAAFFNKYRDPIGYVIAGVAIGLAVAVLILVVAGSRPEPAPTRPVQARLPPSASVAPETRAAPPAPIIITAPAETTAAPLEDPSAKKPPPKPSR